MAVRVIAFFHVVITVWNKTIFHKAVMRKLDTLAVGFPDTYTLIRQDEVSRTYFFPKSYISYRKPRRLSVEQREKAREHMRKINLDDI